MTTFSKTSARGFTLLEVLITLVIFSFGLLALANLVLKSTQYNASALHRSYASSQAYDLADRIRANSLDCKNASLRYPGEGSSPDNNVNFSFPNRDEYACKSACDNDMDCLEDCNPNLTSRCGSYSTFETERNPYNGISGAQDANCVGGGCSATEMARHDLWEWNQTNAAVLPGGTGYVCYASWPTGNQLDSAGKPILSSCNADPSVCPTTCTSGCGYQISVTWEDRFENEGSDSKKCFAFWFRP